MTVKQILTALKSLAEEPRRAHNAKVGPDGAAPAADQFGVPMAALRAFAKTLKADRALAVKLWETGNLEAQLVAALLFKPKDLSAEDLETLTRSTAAPLAADWLVSNVVAPHPDSRALRDAWIKPKNPKPKDRWTSRTAWHLTASLINKGQGAALDLDALLTRLEREMPKAPPEVQWAMNNTLMAIGVKHPPHRPRAIEIGRTIGLYADWPKSKGCIIPYAPEAIEALAKREK